MSPPPRSRGPSGKASTRRHVPEDRHGPRRVDRNAPTAPQTVGRPDRTSMTRRPAPLPSVPVRRFDDAVAVPLMHDLGRAFSDRPAAPSPGASIRLSVRESRTFRRVASGRGCSGVRSRARGWGRGTVRPSVAHGTRPVVRRIAHFDGIFRTTPPRRCRGPDPQQPGRSWTRDRSFRRLEAPLHFTCRWPCVVLDFIHGDRGRWDRHAV